MRDKDRVEELITKKVRSKRFDYLKISVLLQSSMRWTMAGL